MSQFDNNQIMKIIYTRHAKENIEERGLNKNIIENVLKDPDKIKDTRFGRKIVEKSMNGKLLRVIYEKENNTYIVVTAYYTNSERYG